MKKFHNAAEVWEEIEKSGKYSENDIIRAAYSFKMLEKYDKAVKYYEMLDFSEKIENYVREDYRFSKEMLENLVTTRFSR